MSNQRPSENVQASGLIAASPETLPAALQALAANDALPVDETDNIAPAPLKPDALAADLIAEPASPEGQSHPLPNFADNLDAIVGRIDPPATTGPSGIARPDQQPGITQDNLAGSIATSPNTIVAQDNLAQPATAENQAPVAQLNPVGLTTTGEEPFATPIATVATGKGVAAQSDITPINQPAETPLVFKDNAQSAAPLPHSAAEQVLAKANITTDDTLLARPAIEAKAGAVATKSNGEATPAPQNAGPAQTNPNGNAAPDAIAANKAPANAGAPVIEGPAPTKIERNAPLTQAISTTPEVSASPDEATSPTSLMQRLKPLAQAAFSFQGMENTQNNAKTVDGIVPAISMMAAGDLARPSGITGLTSTSGNPASPQVPLNNIAVHIASQASAGHQRFTIRLDPPELGRIDIRLEIGRDGQTLTHLAVEKPETLDLLRQDSRQLERALNNAGLDSRNGSLSFSLKDDSQGKQQAGSSQSDGTPDADENHIEQEGDEPVITRTLNMNSGLDISI